jgi:hypothetical protein
MRRSILSHQCDRGEIDFASVAQMSLAHADVLLRRWLPDGRRRGNEWVALNPTRADTCAGSFRINVLTGRWADFAIGASGGDLISLAAYLFSIGQAEAARRIADMLGVSRGS